DVSNSIYTEIGDLLPKRPR
ncbi:hypothetical protein CP8484711_1310B, partial [Chlamydia psittaci 84-8471/1]